MGEESKGRRLTNEDRAAIKAAYESGMTYSQVCDKFKCSTNTIAKIIHMDKKAGQQTIKGVVCVCPKCGNNIHAEGAYFCCKCGTCIATEKQKLAMELKRVMKNIRFMYPQSNEHDRAKLNEDILALKRAEHYLATEV